MAEQGSASLGLAGTGEGLELGKAVLGLARSGLAVKGEVFYI